MIKLFSKPDCVQCKFSKNKLDELGVPFEEFDVTESEENMAEAIATGYTSMPIIILEDGGIISGFKPAELEALAE